MPCRFTHGFVALCLSAACGLAQPTALSVNTAVREEVRQFYRGIYFASEQFPMHWTGAYASGTPGDTSSWFREATRQRINFYRALVGVPADISFDPTFNAKAQRAALMMSVNDSLSHNPPSSWTFFTPEGAEAAAKSNLALGSAGPDAIDGYMSDAGGNNSAVGHRRWLMYPQTLLMGTGDVPGNGTFLPANAVWVIDGRYGTARPTTRTTHVAYPPAGYVPYPLVWPRWSFSFPGADFTFATVSMRRNGVPIPVTREPVTANIGEPTLVWIYDGLDPESDAPHPRPASDMVYTVNITAVRIGGQLRNFEYNVWVFDPDQPSPGAVPTTVFGPLHPAVGAPQTYTVSQPGFASGFEWRSVVPSPAQPVYTAENGTADLLIKKSSGYAVVQTTQVARGQFAFRLAHSSPRGPEILEIPGTFLIGPDANVTFQSRLGFATPIETARVQVSSDGGASWIDVFRQAGTTAANADLPAPTEAGFIRREVSLAGFAAQTVAIRLNYTIEPVGTAFMPSPANEVGWFIDDLAINQVQRISASPAREVTTGNRFTFAAPQPGTYLLQARALMFGHPLEWGPVTALHASVGGSPLAASYLSNLSVRTLAGTGAQTLIVGFNVAGGSKPLLVRGIGPALTAFGVDEALADPRVELFQGPLKIGENDNWRSEDRTTFQTLGAFDISTGSRDAALVTSVTPNSYTVQLSGAGGSTGFALVELYDAVGAAQGSRFTNLSARSALRSADDVLIAGFNVAGNGPRTLLIRAVGPGLGTFNVAGALANPRLQLYGADRRVIVENENWDATLASTFERVGAFALPNGSHDAALLVTLEPGSYTTQVTGVSGATGVVLIEVYDVP